MNKIKIIELLNMISRGEEVPKKIKYDDEIYIHCDNYCYFCEETNEILSQNIYAEFSRLNDEVEVIEEDKKIYPLFYMGESENEKLNMIKDKINEIIDYLNKGDKE